MLLSWTPLVCFTVIAAIFAVCEFFSSKTKGYISAMVFASVISIGLFWSGIIPIDTAATSTLTTTLFSYGVALLLVNMGTTIELETLLKEWKTVVVCCAGLVGLGILAFTAGVWLFGKEYALTAAPPISGGTIAYQIVAQAATDAGRADLAGFAALVMAVQGLIGMPIASACMKKELKLMHANGKFSNSYKINNEKEFKLPETKLFKDEWLEKESSTTTFAKLGFVAVLSVLFANFTNGIVNANIAYLIFGVIFRKINFLQKNGLQKAGGYGLCLLALYALVINGLAGVTPSAFAAMVLPLVGMLILGATGICIVAVIAGKFLGYSPGLSAAVGVTAMFGYPGTEILSKEVAGSMEDFTTEEKDKALNFIMPKMIVGGFTTVTVASVVFASIIAPMIF